MMMKLIPHMFSWRKTGGPGWSEEDLNMMQTLHKHTLFVRKCCFLKWLYQGDVLMYRMSLMQLCSIRILQITAGAQKF